MIEPLATVLDRFELQHAGPLTAPEAHRLSAGAVERLEQIGVLRACPPATRYAERDTRFAFVNQPTPAHLVHGNTFDAAVADVDNDTDFDIVIAQIRHGWAGDSSDPTALWHNAQDATGRVGFTMLDPVENPHALGAIVRVTSIIDGERVTQSRQLVGIGGRGGKQHAFEVTVGLAGGDRAERVEVLLPDHIGTRIERTDVPAGRRVIRVERTDAED